MRTEKTTLRKVKEWQSLPRLVTGMYRLFTYLTWENIPEEYKQFYPPEAKEVWNEDLKLFKEKNIKLDIDAEIKAVFRGLFKKNITQVLSILPIILADVYMLGKPITKQQVKLNKITEEYLKHLEVDSDLAELVAIFDIVDLLTELSKLAEVNLEFNPRKMLDKILAQNDIKDLSTLPSDIDKQVDAALAAYSLKESLDKDGE